jgi:integral membrane protein (TIGR01906 family)
LRQERRRLAKGLLFGGGLTLFLMAALGIMIAVNFNWFFVEFHLLSFSNDFWQLNPATDYLLMMFPDGFWFDTTLFIALGTGGMALILGGVGWRRLRKDRALQSP